MGGMFIAQRISAPPRSIVMAPSLKKPLLVARAETVMGTEMDHVRMPYSPMAA